MATDGLLGNSKYAEVALCASVTVNVCMLVHVWTPWFCRVVTSKVLRKRREFCPSLEEEVPGFFGRISTSAPFLLAFPICGFVLIATSGAVQDPFFAFTSAMRITFSIAIGHYVYKSGEIIFWRKEVHYKPLLVHHTVTIALFSVIITYEQNAILGITALFLKGNMVFAEFDNDNVARLIERRRPSKACKATAVAAFVGAVVLNGLVPVSLLCAAVVTSSHRLLQMQYIPLAFFFLSLVFFSAVAAWFFNDAFKALRKVFTSEKLVSVLRDFKSRPLTTIVNHNGLEKLYETANGAAVVNIKCNDLWDRDLSQLCVGPVDEKVKNADVVEIKFETPSVLKSTNLL